MDARLNTNLNFVFASANPGKLAEVNAICSSLNWSCISPSSLIEKHGPFPDVIEGETSYQENALIKAKSFFDWCKIPVIADDTGLEVNSLGGSPGVKSARYAGPAATMQQNKEKLLKALEHKKERSALFRCVLCYYNGQSTVYAQATLDGFISDSSTGNAGFGYDDLFIVNRGTSYPLLTLSQLKEEKFIPTHRYLAFQQLKKTLFGN